MVFFLAVGRLESGKGLAQCLAHRKRWINRSDYHYLSLLANASRTHLTQFTWGYSNFSVEK